MQNSSQKQEKIDSHFFLVLSHIPVISNIRTGTAYMLILIIAFPAVLCDISSSSSSSSSERQVFFMKSTSICCCCSLQINSWQLPAINSRWQAPRSTTTRAITYLQYVFDIPEKYKLYRCPAAAAAEGGCVVGCSSPLQFSFLLARFAFATNNAL